MKTHEFISKTLTISLAAASLAVVGCSVRDTIYLQDISVTTPLNQPGTYGYNAPFMSVGDSLYYRDFNIEVGDKLISIVRGDIARQDACAIVNAANGNLFPGGGASGGRLPVGDGQKRAAGAHPGDHGELAPLSPDNLRRASDVRIVRFLG